MNWFRGWLGEERFLPRSDRQGKKMAVTTLIPIQAQLAVFFGSKNPGLETLQRGCKKLSKGEPILCESCGRNIWQDGHMAKCELIAMYQRVMSEPAPAIEKLNLK